MSRAARRLLWLAVVLFVSLPGSRVTARPAWSAGAGVRQLVVAVAPSWDSNRGALQCFERDRRGGWRPVFAKPVPALFGRSGLAWGRGVLTGRGGRVKREGDLRAPAGVFRIGTVFGDPPALPDGARYPYRQVTRWDAWVDDPKNPFYNRHVRVDPKKGIPPWFESQRMRLGDPAYRWLVEVRHNADPPEPGFGSAIFIHVRRGPDRPTAGCTTMAQANLERVLRFLRSAAKPHFVLLPRAEYDARREAWGLPVFP